MAVPITDFGAKIGGARKDLRGTLRVEDLSEMTDIERAEFVTKDMIWSVPDYAALVKAGTSRDAALVIKALRDGLPAIPIIATAASEDEKKRLCAVFIETVRALKPVQEIKTTDGIKNFMLTDGEVRKHIAEITEEARPRYDYDSIASASLSVAPTTGLRKDVYRTDSQLSAYRRLQAFVSTLFNACRGETGREGWKILKKNPDWPFGTDAITAYLRHRAISVEEDGSGKWRITYQQSKDQYFVHSALGDSIQIEGYETRDAAESAARKAVESKLKAARESAKAKREALLARAKGQRAGDGYRKGREWRTAPAVEADYLRDFRLRGGEFGNWVNQEERQKLLDQGYDAFRDLAMLLGYEPSQISLRGTLAIAFGARGRGGWAAAHYEPGREVINLTKPSGEGTLSHELAHAFDHYVGKRAKALGLIASTDKDGCGCFLSEATLHKAKDPVVSDPEEDFLRRLNKVMRKIVHREIILTPEAQKEALASKVSTYRHGLIAELNRGRDGFKTAFAAAVAAKDDARMQALADAEKNFSNGAARFLEAIETRKIDRYFIQSEASDFVKKYLPREVANVVSIKVITNNLNYHGYYLIGALQEMAACTKTKIEIGRTNYAKACIDLDKTRSRPYYSQHCEMFARSFEALVADRLAIEGLTSPFLVNASKGEAYPQGAEREQLLTDLFPLLKEAGTYLTPPVVICDSVPSKQTDQLQPEGASRSGGRSP